MCVWIWQSYCFNCIFDQINAVLLGIRYFSKTLKILTLNFWLIVYVIAITSSSCCSKPVQRYFFCRKQKEIFCGMSKLLLFCAMKLNVNSSNILLNISCVPQKNWGQMGLEQHKGDLMMTVFSYVGWSIDFIG